MTLQEQSPIVTKAFAAPHIPNAITDYSENRCCALGLFKGATKRDGEKDRKPVGF